MARFRSMHAPLIPERRRSPACPVLLFFAMALGCASTPTEPGETSQQSAPLVREVDQAFYTRRTLIDARMFRKEGRLEAAERALERGLRVSPDDPRLNWMMGEILDELGREGGDAFRRRADAIAPPPLPDASLDPPGEGVVVVLLPPDRADVSSRLIPPSWPDDEVAAALEQRLAIRLPAASVIHADPESVDAARNRLRELEPKAVISLRVERAYCGNTLKDGRFAIGQLRIAAARRGAKADESLPADAREILSEPRLAIGCKIEAVARALERALLLPGVSHTLRDVDSGEGVRSPDWPTASIRALFPGLGARIEEHLESGRNKLAAGNISEAAEAFQHAEAIDRADPTVRAYLEEVGATLAIARQLTPGENPMSGVVLDPRISPERQRALENQLEAERQRRLDLLAALAVVEESAHLPPMDVLAALRPSEVGDPDAFGPKLAARESPSGITERVAFAPDGSAIARYYFAAGEALPVVREEDTTFDGIPDRWTRYEGNVRQEVWESGHGSETPDVHLVFGPSGEHLERIEFDTVADGRTDRIYHYADGALEKETRDTSGDGRMDRVDRFDESGNLEVTERDLDGDGNVDVRDYYEGGRLIRRELTNAADGE